jgi:cupin 2 domain-containing protein
MADGNIFSDIPAPGGSEEFISLLASATARIERIVSHGHASPPGSWYDQEQTEWVLVLDGAAALRFEGEDGTRMLQRGDYLMIPAHARHRVEWTDPAQATVWLAVHLD